MISTETLAQIIRMRHDQKREDHHLRTVIEDLNEDEQAELVAIMWIGRGSFEADDFDEAIRTAKSEATIPTADYLLGTPHLADHLEAGIEALGIDLDEDGTDV
ncbi:DUF3775 domain-containing protein [Rhodobacterales bacterium HKCCE3408]|nr:DUF3775 domain-containing protein [Rhodobacterales bacterium HKCCE3408]